MLPAEVALHPPPPGVGADQPAAPGAAGQTDCNVLVAGLTQEVDDAAFRSLAAPFGDIVSAVVMVNIGTGRSRGFGFVRYADPAAAAAAIRGLGGRRLGRNVLHANLSVHRGRETRAGSRSVYIRNVPADLPAAAMRRAVDVFGPVCRCVVAPDYAPLPGSRRPAPADAPPPAAPSVLQLEAAGGGAEATQPFAVAAGHAATDLPEQARRDAGGDAAVTLGEVAARGVARAARRRSVGRPSSAPGGASPLLGVRRDADRCGAAKWVCVTVEYESPKAAAVAADALRGTRLRPGDAPRLLVKLSTATTSARPQARAQERSGQDMGLPKTQPSADRALSVGSVALAPHWGGLPGSATPSLGPGVPPGWLSVFSTPEAGAPLPGVVPPAFVLSQDVTASPDIAHQTPAHTVDQPGRSDAPQTPSLMPACVSLVGPESFLSGRDYTVSPSAMMEGPESAFQEPPSCSAPPASLLLQPRDSVPTHPAHGGPETVELKCSTCVSPSDESCLMHLISCLNESGGPNVPDRATLYCPALSVPAVSVDKTAPTPVEHLDPMLHTLPFVTEPILKGGTHRKGGAPGHPPSLRTALHSAESQFGRSFGLR